MTSNRFRIGSVFQKYLMLEILKYVPSSQSHEFLWEISSAGRFLLVQLSILLINTIIVAKDKIIIICSIGEFEEVENEARELNEK